MSTVKRNITVFHLTVGCWQFSGITSAVAGFHYWYDYNKIVDKCWAGINPNGNA